MEEQTPDKLDLAALLTSFAGDLAKGSGRVTIRNGLVREVAPQSRITLRQLRSKLGVRQDASTSTVETTYRHRSEAMNEALERRRARLEAFAERVRSNIPTKEDRFLAAGQLTDKQSGNGLPNVGVRAVKTFRGKQTVLAETRTDALGYFRVETDGTSGFDLEFMDENGAVLNSAKPADPKKGTAEFIAVSGDGSRVPESRAVSKKIAESVAHNEAGLDRRKDTLSRKLQSGVTPVVRVVETRVKAPRIGVKEIVEKPVRPKDKQPKPVDKKDEEREKREEKQKEKEKDDREKRRPETPVIELEKVDGVGPKFAARLRDAGIKNANELAKANPKKVSTVLKAGGSRAERIVEAAKAKVAGRG
jgi:predicted flap endonuclease-1-like 5' DNA nuclease